MLPTANGKRARAGQRREGRVEMLQDGRRCSDSGGAANISLVSGLWIRALIASLQHTHSSKEGQSKARMNIEY